MFCLLIYSPKQKIVKFHAQKQIGKSHVIDIFTSEDMENISLCIFQYLTLYLTLFSKFSILIGWQAVRKNPYPDRGPYIFRIWTGVPDVVYLAGNFFFAIFSLQKIFAF
jgi:uncharacterized protein with PQ loop repeat